MPFYYRILYIKKKKKKKFVFFLISCYNNVTTVFKKSLKIPKRFSEFVNKITSINLLSLTSVVVTMRSFLHSWLTTGFVTRVTRWVPMVGYELLISPESVFRSLV